jgi:hypothetical protein
MMHVNSRNESLIRQFSNIPAASPEIVSWVKESTPFRELEEVVEVKMAPSYFFREFVKEYLTTINNFFVGPFEGSRPKLDASVFVCERNEEVELSPEKIFELISEGKTKDEILAMKESKIVKEVISEEELLLRYFETEFWAVIAYNKREFCRKPHLKNLLNHIGRQSVYTPILFVNALNCIGPVQVAEKAVRLEPTFIEEYEYEKRLLSREQVIAVSNWFEQLQEHGFRCVEYLKLGANGNRDFMMMTLEHSQRPSKDELNGKGEAKTEFNVRSIRIAANIVGLYRYFFYTDEVKYFSTDRRTYRFGTCDSNLFTMQHIVKTMLNIGEQELFNAKTSTVAMKGDKPGAKNPDTEASQKEDSIDD